MNELISVIIPVYNEEKHIEESINSIIKQTYKNLEIIVIDDGSTDGSLDILKKFQKFDSRIALVSRENKGLITTLNEGVDLSKGVYIARMDADDISLPNRLFEQVEYLKNNAEIDIVGTQAIGIGADGKFIKNINKPRSSNEINTYMLLNSPLIHPSIVIRRKCIKLNLFDEKDYLAEDYGAWLRLNTGKNIANLKGRLIKYRIHPGSISQQKKEEQFENTKKIRKRNLINSFFIYKNEQQSNILLLHRFHYSFILVLFSFFMNNHSYLSLREYMKVCAVLLTRWYKKR